MQELLIPNEDTARQIKPAPRNTELLLVPEEQNAAPLPLNAFCITLYNEELSRLQGTICSLLNSILQALPGVRKAAGFSTIYIIADGRDQVDPAILALFRRIGLWSEKSEETAEFDLVSYFRRCDLLLEQFGQRPPATASSEQVQIVVCMKRQNSGKLHSHLLFFARFCRDLNPRYCYQIDAGTIVSPYAIGRLTQRMEEADELAAIAPAVMPEMTSLSAPLICLWQYLDFAYRKAILFPVETATGYLTVIPGQISVFRWRALLGEEPSGDGNDCPESPLRSYLRGLSATDAMDLMMYLAEDRVIGAELVLAKGTARQWRLDYLPEASALTDSCETFRELLRQRRRWNNSANACRFWVLQQWHNFVRRHDRHTRAKARFSVAMLTQSILGLRELSTPAQLIALLLAISSVAATTPRSLQAAFWTLTGIELLLTCAYEERISSRFRWTISLSRRLVGCSASVLFVSLIVTALPATGAIILLAPALALPVMALSFPRAIQPVLIKCQFSPVPVLSTASVLFMYSFWNLDDVSWGTKGILSSTVKAASRQALRRTRHRMFSLWLLWNAALVACAFQFSGPTGSELNVVTEVSCLVDGLFALAALTLTFIRHRAQPRRLEVRA